MAKEKIAEITYRVPLAVSAEALMEFYGRPKKGQEFDYEEIADIIGEEYVPGDTNSWYRITRIWRDKVMEKWNMVIAPKDWTSRKFRVLNDVETVKHVHGRTDKISGIVDLSRREVKTINVKKLSAREKYALDVEVIKLHAWQTAEKRKFTMKEAAKLARESTTTVNQRPMLVPLVPDERLI